MDVIKRYVALGLGVSVGPRLAIDAGDERQLGIVNLSNLLPVEQAGVLTLRARPYLRRPGTSSRCSRSGSVEPRRQGRLLCLGRQ